jgi:hypothetical protein
MYDAMINVYRKLNFVIFFLAVLVLTDPFLPPKHSCAEEKKIYQKHTAFNRDVAASLPWKKGDRINSLWAINRIDVHPEFIRLFLKKDIQATVIEISYKKTNDSLFSTKYYLVQAAPGCNAPVILLNTIVSELKKIEKQPGYIPFVKMIPRISNVGEKRDEYKMGIAFKDWALNIKSIFYKIDFVTAIPYAIVIISFLVSVYIIFKKYKTNV